MHTPSKPFVQDNQHQQSDGSVDCAFPEPVAGTPLHAAKRRVGQAMRRLSNSLIMSDTEVAYMEAMAQQMEAMAAQLEGAAQKAPRTSFGHRMNADDVRDFIEFSPLTGRANPVAAPLDMWVADGKALARVNFGRSFEGAPGVVHGGFVAAIFDELLGFVQGFAERPGMTGTLTVIYRSPTPLFTDLHLEGTFDGLEGRKIYTSGRLYAGDTLLAEATGIFIALTDAQYAALAPLG